MVISPSVYPGSQIYLNLMEEARLRLDAMQKATDERDVWPARFLQEYCYLQLRMLCEIIALGCIVAHGDVTSKNILKKYEPSVMLARLETLNANFFPTGVRFRFEPDAIHLDTYHADQLTKSELKKLWKISGQYLHRGSAIQVMSEDPATLVVNLDPIMIWRNKIIALLDNHFISSADRKSHICVALLGEDGKAYSFIAQSR